MSLIDIRCVNDHLHEVNRPAADWPNTPVCPTCGAPTEQIHLPPQTTWTLDPVVVYRAPDGSIRFPGDTTGVATAKYDRLGYERVELRSAAEVRRFEAHMEKTEFAHAQRRAERLQALRERRESELRSELFHRMHTMSPFGRAVARAAIARNNAKPVARARESGFHVDVYSNDRSNRDESRGPDGRRRRD